jgi:3-hydroxy-3-methylglutaryl CoA synthase
MSKKNKIPAIGISQIGIVIPKYYLSTEELARKRKISPQYPTEGLGIFQIRIPYKTSLEELAAKAVSKIEFRDAKRFYIGTESDSDISKPLGVKILSQKLKLNLVPFQYKFSCLGGILALISACEYCYAHKGKPVIALAVDRSIYRKTRPEAEMTQGCAAIAMRIEMNPKLLILDFQNLGQYSNDIDDFKVPSFSFPFPKVKGELTKVSYLNCQKMALEDWKRKNFQLLKKFKKRGESILESFDFFIMHTPFPKIVEWLSAVFWRHEKLKRKPHLTLQECLKKPSLFRRYKKEIDQIRKLSQFQDFFEKKVKPGLKYNPYVGNSYTCSLFLSLISVLEKVKKGEEIGILGYGSGAGAICLRGIANGKSFESDLEKQIKGGKKLKVEEYERWRKKYDLGNS